ncbi:hypothetical protein [Pimelobacter simplex]|nr:hypothetical protein [Pimelobacter simplex]
MADGSWELGQVSLGEDGTGFAELRETTGGTTLGIQADLRDGAWCALQ